MHVCKKVPLNCSMYYVPDIVCIGDVCVHIYMCTCSTQVI